jgi:hypothetical protein
MDSLGVYGNDDKAAVGVITPRSFIESGACAA